MTHQVSLDSLSLAQLLARLDQVDTAMDRIVRNYVAYHTKKQCILKAIFAKQAHVSNSSTREKRTR
jgi:hypothetical protein